MKTGLRILILVLSFSFAKAQTAGTIHTYTALTIDSNLFNFSNYYGKKILVVNVASYCAYTPQYADLETLYQTYKSNNFEILGFPCNDFGGQEPGKDSTINVFCTSNYNVTFKMMKKISITASDTAPVYKWLQRGSLNGVASNAVTWNFNKFCINEAGQLVAYHPSTTTPLDTAITNWILKPSVVAGIAEKDGIEAALLSENPVSDLVSLVIKNNSSASYQINLYSTEGRLVKTVCDQNLSSKQITFSVSDVASGMYFLRVENASSKKDIKLIITR